MLNRSRQPVLSVQQVKKRIRNKWIIKGVSFDIHEGEIFGFLGPNGSGKTTTIRMLVNLIKPTEGRVLICGLDVQKQHQEAMKYVGCIVENPELYPYLTGWENLEHFADMLLETDEDRITEVVHLTGLTDRIHDKVKTYSLGMRQRLGIAQALLGRPKLLILDEPTNGLDPQGIKQLRLFIRELAAQGISLFISSHLLSEIQMMCDRVAIIRQGEVIAVDRVDDLLKQSEIQVVWKVEPKSEAIQLMQDDSNVSIVSMDTVGFAEELDSRDHLVTEMDPDLVPKWNERFISASINVYSIEVKTPNLEHLFLKMTEGEIT